MEVFLLWSLNILRVKLSWLILFQQLRILSSFISQKMESFNTIHQTFLKMVLLCQKLQSKNLMSVKNWLLKRFKLSSILWWCNRMMKGEKRKSLSFFKMIWKNLTIQPSNLTITKNCNIIYIKIKILHYSS